MAKHSNQFNVYLDEQARADAKTIARRFHLNGMAAAIRYALRNMARGLQERKIMKRAEIQAMSAKQLWEELEALRKERSDFDELEIYVDVVSRDSYEEEQAWDGEGEFTETYIAEGSAFELVVPTSYDLSGPKAEKIGDYILIRSVELDG